MKYTFGGKVVLSLIAIIFAFIGIGIACIMGVISILFWYIGMKLGAILMIIAIGVVACIMSGWFKKIFNHGNTK